MRLQDLKTDLDSLAILPLAAIAILSWCVLLFPAQRPLEISRRLASGQESPATSGIQRSQSEKTAATPRVPLRHQFRTIVI